MCQSKSNGGRRCDLGKTLKNKEEKAAYIKKSGQDIPKELVEEIVAIKAEHAIYEQEQVLKEDKRKNGIKAKEARDSRRIARQERKEQLVKEQEALSANKKVPAIKALQLYLSPKENQAFNEIAVTTFLATKKENGTLTEFLNKSAKTTNKDFVEYDVWKEENGEAPEAYLNSYGLTVKGASTSGRERLYDGIRDKVEGPIVLTSRGDKAISEEAPVLQKIERGIVGRVQSNYGKQSDNSTRSEKRDIMLTEEGNTRVERIAQIFNISKGDVLRNQVTGTDHRIRQFHQSIPKYNSRKNVIASYEKEGGDYRKKDETVSEMYERLISDGSIELKN